MNKLALYIRLSMEDRFNNDESESVVNQRLFLRDYISSHKEFKVYSIEEYIDDGYSGTNENRPAFQKMLNDVKSGDIKLIIVKDLSRFMRDYIGIGDYLGNIFPFLGVRFISINDGYDSLNENGNGIEFDVQFKSLLYDFYSKDISEKVSSVSNSLRNQGKFLSAQAPFGYIKDPNDKHKLIIDKNTAWIVKRIYKMLLDGASIGEITRTLNKENVIVPSERKRELSQKKGDFDKFIVKKTWSNGTVNSILSNENYTGVYVFNRREHSFKSGKKYKKIPKDKWLRIYDSHEAIISAEDFNRVQDIKSRKKFAENNGNEWYLKSPLQGFLRCNICDHYLTCVKTSNKTKTMGTRVYRYFSCRHCKENNIYGNSSKASVLEELVFSAIREHFDISLNDTKVVVDISVLEKDIENLQNKKMNYYEQYKLNKISKDDFKNIKIKIDDSIHMIQEEINHNKVIPDNELDDKLTRNIMSKYIDSVVCGKNSIEKINWK